MPERNFIDEFATIVDKRTEVLAIQEQSDYDARLEEERAYLDQLENDEIQKRIAIADRTKTLNMAWVAAGLLTSYGVSTQEWFSEVEVRKEIGRFRKREVVVGTRPKLALDGWKLYDFNVLTPPRTSSYFSLAQRATTLVLLKEGGISAITKWDSVRLDGYDWEPGTAIGTGPRVIEPLQTDPMEDTVLSHLWTKNERPFDSKGERIGLGPKISGHPGLRQYAGKDGEGADYKAASHERHNRYGIENRIRTALGDLVAHHNIQIPK